jgi:hypothetical protein
MALLLFANDIRHVMAAPEVRPIARLGPTTLLAFMVQHGGPACFTSASMFRERTRANTIANWLATRVALAGYMLLIPRYLGMRAPAAMAAGIRGAQAAHLRRVAGTRPDPL